MKSCLQFFHRIFSPSPGPPSRGLVLVAVAASLLFVSSTFAVAQEASSIVGTVTLENTGGALHGARVLIINLGRSTLSDEDGRFRFDGVPAGQHELLAMREHLQADRQTVEVGAGEATTVDFALALAAVHEEVTVTATGRITTAFDAFNTVQALDSIDLAQNMAGNLGELLENEPGVAKRSFGPGSSRPIIRGFDNDRVLLMQDGVRSGDLSSQSGDHGVSIDPAALGRVEILKGPATLLYGSNAIGGVVNAISPHQAFYENPPAELRGQLNADLGSTNEQAGGNANFQVGNGKIMAWFGGGGRRTSEYITPEGTVENSQTEQMNGRAGLGWFGDRDYISVSYEIEDGTYGIPFAGELHGHHEEEEEEEEEEPLIDIDQRRQVVRVEGGLRNLQGRFIDGVKAIFSYVDWQHQEIESFADTGVREVGTEFDNKHYIGRIEVQQTPTERLQGQFGAWGQRRDYVAMGEEALAPPTQQDALAAFAYEELELKGWSLQFGGRIETNKYKPEASERAAGHEEEEGEHHAEEAPEVRDRTFAGFSGSVGVRVPFAENRAALVANFTSSYRAPALEELYNFGPHVGNLAFEIGNPDLEHERSNGGEVNLRLNTGKVRGQASVFYYDISNFIFGAPTGEVVDELLELKYEQGDSRFVGADLALSFHLDERWLLHVSSGVIDARLEDTDEALPRIPPLSGRLALDWLPVNGLLIRPELLVAAKQDNVFGAETPTDGYTTANLMASYTIAGSKMMHVFTLKSTNLGDTLYRNHTSLIKDLAPEMGRRVLLTYGLRLF